MIFEMNKFIHHRNMIIGGFFMLLISVLSANFYIVRAQDSAPTSDPQADQSTTQTAEARHPSVQNYQNFRGCAVVGRSVSQWKDYPSEWMILPDGISYFDEEMNFHWFYTDFREPNPISGWVPSENENVYTIVFCVTDDIRMQDSRNPKIINYDVKISDELFENLWEYVFRGPISGGTYMSNSGRRVRPFDYEQEYYFSLLVQETYQGLGLDPPRPLPKPASIIRSEKQTQEALTPSPTITKTPEPTHTPTSSPISTRTPNPTSTLTPIPTDTASPFPTQAPTPVLPASPIESYIDNYGIYLLGLGAALLILFIIFIRVKPGDG